MTNQQLITLLEYLLYCLRAYNISGYEREQAINDTKAAIKCLKDSNKPTL